MRSVFTAEWGAVNSMVSDLISCWHKLESSLFACGSENDKIW